MTRTRIALAALRGVSWGAPLLLTAAPMWANTYYVSPSGSNSGDGSPASPWQTIGYALASGSPVGPGDTVLIQPGTYTEDVLVQRSGAAGSPITIKGSGSRGDIKIVEPNTGNGWQTGTIQISNQHDLVLDGLRIENSGWGGVTIMSCSNITVQNCYTYNTGGSGVIALFAGGNEQWGEWEVQNHNIKVLHCTVDKANQKNDQESISMWGVDGFEVAYNLVRNGACEGIDAKVGSRNGSLHHNEVTNVGTTTAFWGYGAPAIYCDSNKANAYNIDVYDNYVHDSNGNGITFAGETDGYTLSNVRVFNNVCVHVGLANKAINGFAIGSNCDGISIYNNTDINNAIDYAVFGTNRNCRIVNNIAAGSGGWRPVQIDQTTNLLLDHNMIRGDVSVPIGYGSGQDANTTATNNLLVSLASMGLADPSGASPGSWNLTSSSPAINAASASIGSSGLSAPSTDYDSNARPVGGGYDIGAVEYAASGAVAPIGQTISFKASNGYYVSCDQNAANNILDAKYLTSSPSSWEQFQVVDAGGGYIGLKASNGYYVSCDLNNGAVLDCIYQTGYLGDWEKFTWQDLGGGTFALKAKANGYYVTADQTVSGTTLDAKYQQNGPQGWETFSGPVTGLSAN